jgi:hypothetical protein
VDPVAFHREQCLAGLQQSFNAGLGGYPNVGQDRFQADACALRDKILDLAGESSAQVLAELDGQKEGASDEERDRIDREAEQRRFDLRASPTTLAGK